MINGGQGAGVGQQLIPWRRQTNKNMNVAMDTACLDINSTVRTTLAFTRRP